MNSAKEELEKAYQKLSLDEKRNEFNNELMSISYIIKAYLKEFDDEDYSLAKNYISKEEINLSEEDLLVRNYMDLLEIKNRLILLLKFISVKDKNY